jgi:hypothetical protein
MTTQQHDAAAMTDKQMDAVTGGIILNNDGGRRSSNPTPHPSPFVTRRPTMASGRARLAVGPGYVGVVNPDSM